MTKALVDFMLAREQFFTGTVQSNRVGFPVQVKEGLNLEHNESKYFATADNQIIYCAWQDKKAKKPVLIVSSKTSVGDTLSTRKNRPKPVVIDNYNQFMSGCDRADQLVGYYGHQQR